MPVAENHHTGRDRPRLWTSPLAGPVILLFITIAFFWKLVLTDQFTWMESPDTANQILPWFQFQAGEWHRGRFPLWDPHLWGGQSLIGQAQPGAAYPPNWILFLTPLGNGWIRQSYLHWYFVLLHFMAALFGYWLCRDLKRSRAASVIAGAAFGLGGVVGTTDWPQMLNGAIWAPLVFLFLFRALRGVRPLASAALSGTFLGIAWLSGHHQFPIFMTIAAGAVWLFHVFRNGRPEWGRLRLAGAFLVLLVFTSGLQVLPAYEYGRLSKRWVGAHDPVGWKEPVPYSVHSEFSLFPMSILGVVVPGIHRHSSPFVGVAGLTMVFFAVCFTWHIREVRILSAVAAAGILFSLGKNSVLHGVMYALVPMVEKARSPSMAILMFHFGLSVLIAYGIDTCLSDGKSSLMKRAAIWLTGLAGFVFALLLALILLQKAPGDDRFVVTGLVALLLAAFLQGLRTEGIGWGAFAGLVLLLILTEQGNNTGIYYPHKGEKERTILLKKLREHADIAEFLRRQPFPFRIEFAGEEARYNFGDWYGIDVMGGYVASLPENLLRLPYHDRRGKAVFGVTYTVNREGPGPRQRQVFESKSGLRVHANLDSWPRVWTVHEARGLRSAGEIPVVLGDESFDLRRKTFLLGPPPALERCDGEDAVGVLSHEPNRVVIEARMACRGLVILGDNYFPGWKATVDGRGAPIHEAYTVVRGVVVERGVHRIEMVYRPLSVILGGIMTALGLACAAVLALMAKLRGQ